MLAGRVLPKRLLASWSLALIIAASCGGQAASPGPAADRAAAPTLPRPTETTDERRARLLASQPGLAGFLTEGRITSARCDLEPPEFVITGPGGAATVRLLSPGFDCWRARPGDYLFVTAGTKQSDQLYDGQRLLLDTR